MGRSRYCIGLFLVLLCRSGMTFFHRPSLECRLSFAHMGGQYSSRNSSFTVNSESLTTVDSQGNMLGSPLAPNNVASYSTNNVRTNYRSGGSEFPLTVSSSIGSHSYRENRPSNEKFERSDRDRERASGNIPRTSKDRPSCSTAYRGRSTSRSATTGGPDVIFSSGYDSNRNAQRGGSKESLYASDDRDSRESSYANNQKNVNKSWKSRRPFESSTGGIETTQDYPSSSYRTVVYDHLATSSLEGIEALPHIKLSKGRTYLTKWWQAAKKWNLLDDELKEIEQVYLSIISPATVTVSTDRSNVMIGSQSKVVLTASPSPTRSKQNSEIRLIAESDRIAEVLSQLIGSDNLSESVRPSVSDTPLQSLNSFQIITGDSKNNISTPVGFSESSELRSESSAENKINDLIDKTIQSVGLFEISDAQDVEVLSTSSDTGKSDSLLSSLSAIATAQGTDELLGMGEKRENPDVWGTTVEDVSRNFSRDVGNVPVVPGIAHSDSSSEYMEENEMERETGRVSDYDDSSSRSESKNNNNENSSDDGNKEDKRLNYNQVSSWNSNKLEENEELKRGNDRYNNNDRTQSENDLSVPVEELYRLCDRHKARVICIGDVHGCVEELKDLLRAVSYRPGDLVLLLGDLVAKGLFDCLSLLFLFVCLLDCLPLLFLYVCLFV